MGLTALDIAVLILVGGAAVLGWMRGLVTEALSLAAWAAVVVAVRLFHMPVAKWLAEPVGTEAGAATLAFAIVAGGVYAAGRLVVNAIGGAARQSVLGPVDRALGFGFGALKGFVLASLAFLLVVLVVDLVEGGVERRPEWMKASRTYPLLNATSATIAQAVDRRRRGEPMFGEADAPAENAR